MLPLGKILLADDRPIVGRSKNLAVDKGLSAMYVLMFNCSSRPTKLYLSADKNAKFFSADHRPIVCLTNRSIEVGRTSNCVYLTDKDKMSTHR